MKGPSRTGTSYSLDAFLDERRFSPSTLRVWWFVFFAVHAICLVYYALMMWCYWNLPKTTMNIGFYFYGLGMGDASDRVIAVVHGCFAGIHSGYLLWMIGWSLKEKRLVFAVYNVFALSTVKRRRWYRLLAKLYQYTIGNEMVGVTGPYYDLILACREILETALQTQQAYRMTLFLSRTVLIRSYIALLVLSCWSTVIVHSVFHSRAVRRRFYALVCDSILDFMTAVGVPIALLAVYYPDFDFKLNDFPLRTWGNDFWLMPALSEFEMILVTSWGNLAMRIVFAWSTLSSVDRMKKLLSTSAIHSRHGSCQSRQSTAVLHVYPIETTTKRRSVLAVIDAAAAHESRFTRLLFFAWGVVIIVLQAYAESVPGLSECKMQVKPWFCSLPACSLVVFDCYTSDAVGSETDIAAQWRRFDPQTPAGVVIKHCPKLEIPTTLTDFSQLKMLKIYNSTIDRWDESATLSQTHHPNLLMLLMARVNFTDGMLPAGVLGDDFPHGLLDIELCITNLRALPEDFDTKWSKDASIYFEGSKFTEVPASLVRLAPYDLSLSFNPIASIPAALFEGNVEYLHLGGTLISELPENVRDVSPLNQLRVDDTNISFFWSWLDPIVASAGIIFSDIPAVIVASNSPYCHDLESIYSGNQTAFSAVYHQDQSTILSDASIGNWEALKKAVWCGESPGMYYPVAEDDKIHGIGC